MGKQIDRIFKCYGVAVQVENASGIQTVKAFFRSVTSDAWQNVERVFSPLGETPRGRYICLLPAGVDVVPEDTLTVRGKRYLVRRTEPIAVFTDVICKWCLCMEKGSGKNGA